MKPFRLACVMTGLILVTSAANAAFVGVQWPGGSQQLAYPLVAEASGAGYAARADLRSGIFEAASWVEDGNSLAYSDFSLLQLKYVAPASEPTKPLLLPAGWITVDATASFAVASMPEAASSFNNGQLQANVAVFANQTSHVAAVSQSVVETPGGGGSVTVGTTNSQNGGQGIVNESSAAVLDATLRLPALALEPNSVFRLSGLLQTNVLSNFGLVSVDAASTYEIRMKLPADFDGELIDTATGQPFAPEWVIVGEVPEPGSTLMLLAGLAFISQRLRR